MPPAEYAARRRELMQLIGDEGIAIIPAATEKVRNRDVHYPFRQDSDFRYLTGFPEPDAVAVLVPGREQGAYLLFCRERNPEREVWDGPRAGQEGAVRDYGADDAFPIDDIDDILPGLMEGRERVHYTMGLDKVFDQRVIDWARQVRGRTRGARRGPDEFIALEHHLHEMRLIKRPAELDCMRRAARVTGKAHRRAMQACRPGMMEYELEAEFLAAFRRAGGEPAYPSIVGGGGNGCVLHYILNRDKLRDGDLVLIDAGCELDGYAADVTRTFPVNGRFSAEQRALYEVVLAAQEAAIAAVTPGVSWNLAHERATETLVDGLLELGILDGSREQILEEESYKRFFMHRTGHWLGMDVHDVGDYRIDGQWRELEPGMTLTIEPGLYIAPESDGVAERWRGIGVRIEDDLLVTREGHENLTPDIPKAPDAIEALMVEARS
ncbi:Xaa-Pro aminopeptidase [Alkalilimnicola ehrlichii MLHE-1]|uniref:Xaa-Pro aminopeptidase n=1 Tax=Alkalilimnicola ehrlichii (strain ATCC BAA-1101 / DSM 17681 / MLHE-1) TaxID=187272 RepID=Q0A5K5_ALKEH|nr:Xaa-Pro aminopeptidase [Alkalilimnicola ehrlichii]ABI57882.1 aminopeptidase P [Alkalilimnicola ehrlichii MLHE-1]